jgi:hypothetical protein
MIQRLPYLTCAHIIGAPGGRTLELKYQIRWYGGRNIACTIMVQPGVGVRANSATTRMAPGGSAGD